MNPGHVFDLLVQLAVAQGDTQQAYRFLQMMGERGIVLHDCVDPEVWMP